MLRTGIFLLSSSSLGVLYRHAELAYSMLPLVKWLSLMGLMASLICFITIYLRAEMPNFRRTFVRRSDMIKSPVWG